MRRVRGLLPFIPVDLLPCLTWRAKHGSKADTNFSLSRPVKITTMQLARLGASFRFFLLLPRKKKTSNSRPRATEREVPERAAEAGRTSSIWAPLCGEESNRCCSRSEAMRNVSHQCRMLKGTPQKRGCLVSLRELSREFSKILATPISP